MKLVFVYNADSGLFNSVFESIHKVISPQTYSCNLCTITHSTFSINKKWAEFVKELPIETEFLHRDEFRKIFGSTDFEFPIIFKSEKESLELFISTDIINKMKTEEELIENIQKLISQTA